MRPKFTPAEIRELISELQLLSAACFDPRPRSTADRAKDALEYLLQFVEWQDARDAPKDGTKVDLLYPFPRGRTIDCYWEHKADMRWTWRTPTWEDGELLPEEEWDSNSYPNMEPTHFKLVPPPLHLVCKAGACRSGSDSRGSIWHYTDREPMQGYPALCGAMPAIQWSVWRGRDETVSCKKCKKLAASPKEKTE